MTPQEQLYAHLDECRQCREQPFNLCAVGAPLLIATARLVKPPLNFSPPDPHGPECQCSSCDDMRLAFDMMRHRS